MAPIYPLLKSRFFGLIFATSVVCAGQMLLAPSAYAAPPAAATPDGDAQPKAVPLQSLPPRAPLPADTLAKIAAMRPLFDGNTLDGWIQSSSERFAGKDIPDLRAFAKRLLDHRDAVSQFLYAKFDDAGKASVAAIVTTTPIPKNVVQDLSGNLNAIIESGICIYDAARFHGVTLRPETAALLANNPADVGRNSVTAYLFPIHSAQKLKIAPPS